MTIRQKSQRFREMMEDAAAYVATEKPVVCEPTAVTAFMRPLIRDLEQEVFFVLHLNAKNGIIECQEVTKGLVDRTQIHPREVFRQAIIHNASRVILAHNHPSGDATPSSQDISATRQLVEAGKILGIEVLDHVVIGASTENNKGYISLRQENLI